MNGLIILMVGLHPNSLLLNRFDLIVLCWIKYFVCSHLKDHYSKSDDQVKTDKETLKRLNSQHNNSSVISIKLYFVYFVVVLCYVKAA